MSYSFKTSACNCQSHIDVFVFALHRLSISIRCFWQAHRPTCTRCCYQYENRQQMKLRWV